MSELSFVRVRHYHQAMRLMRVRNECREGMTHDTNLISFEQQERFFFKHLDPHGGDGKYEAYLLLDVETPIGYGLLKWDVELNRYWMTAGLIPKYRGKGLSRLIINFITEMGHRDGKEVWIDVYDDNLALIGDIRNGYEFVESNIQEGGKILHLMRHNRERILHPREAFKLFEKTGKVFRTSGDLGDFATEMIEVDNISREAYSKI